MNRLLRSSYSTPNNGVTSKSFLVRQKLHNMGLGQKHHVWFVLLLQLFS